jgi:hypothetical protein
MTYRIVADTEYDSSGQWCAVSHQPAPYRTRMVVVRPESAAQFSGTVVVNWQNVTRGFEMGSPPQDLAELGLAWVGVSAQRVGHCGFPGAESVALKAWDPERYGALLHPGDRYSFDVFTQAARMVGPDRSGLIEGPDPMDGLPVSRMLATGTSQSALHLRSYANAVQPACKVFDGFFLTLDIGSGAMLDSTGSPSNTPLRIPSVQVRIRDDLGVPVMVVNSESEVSRYHSVRQPETGSFCLWEIAGSAHISRTPTEADAIARQLQDVGIDPSMGLVRDLGEANVVPLGPVVRAALRRALFWLQSGIRPPSQALVEVVPGDPPVIRRDEHGIAIGGVRLPDVEAPLAEHCGIRSEEHEVLKRITGFSKPFPAAKLADMYSGLDDYMNRYSEALDAAIGAGILLEEERVGLMTETRITAAQVLRS